MTRLIDADALIELLAGMQAVCHTHAELVGISKVWQQVKNMPTVDAEPHWIPCSERLPEINEHHVSDVCLVYIDDGAMMFSEMQENIFGQRFWECERDDDYHKSVGEVIAWMPLPKPYEVKNE